MLDEDDSFYDYESGPFCRHWAEPGECDEKCASCGHSCTDHYDSTSCGEPNCKCEGWKEQE